MILLAIDPGRDTGWALFSDMRLALCGMCSPEDYRDVFPLLHPSRAIIERPTVYPGARNAEDIVTLAARMGRIQSLLDCPCEEVEPRTWKRQVPKEIHNRRTLFKLTPEERALIPVGPKAHNVIDAVALGLWKLGRML